MNNTNLAPVRKFFKGGFTLMEMLAVVLIIGILSSVALPQYRKVVEKGKFTKAQVMVKAMYDSCERIKAEWGVETYSALPASVRSAGLGRLDIIGPDTLPTGFSYSGNVLTGAGFQYTLQKDCEVKAVVKEGTYTGASVEFKGTGFTCADNGATGACSVFGLD